MTAPSRAYRPDHFAETYKRENGAVLWDFLHRDINLTRMETASYLGRPAIEPLVPALLDRFDAPVARPHIRQMVGHMVRQIMEARGFRLTHSNVKITRRGNFFRSGSRYARIEDIA